MGGRTQGHITDPRNTRMKEMSRHITDPRNTRMEEMSRRRRR